MKVRNRNRVEQVRVGQLLGRGGMASCFACFGGEAKKQRREEERLASEEARTKAAEAAQKRQEEFEKSAAGRAARAQIAAAAKQLKAPSQGEPVLKWQMG